MPNDPTPPNTDTPAPAENPRPPKRRWVGYGLLIVLVLGTVTIMNQFIIGPSYANVDEAVPWRTDLQQVMASAGASDQLVLVEFTADWCPPCQAMSRDVYSRDDVAEAMTRGFVPVRMDMTTSDNAQGARLVRRYGVQGYPTLLAISPATGELHAVIPGAIGAQQLMNHLDRLRPAPAPDPTATPGSDEDQKVQAEPASPPPAG